MDALLGSGSGIGEARGVTSSWVSEGVLLRARGGDLGGGVGGMVDCLSEGSSCARRSIASRASALWIACSTFLVKDEGVVESALRVDGSRGGSRETKEVAAGRRAG